MTSVDLSPTRERKADLELTCVCVCVCVLACDDGVAGGGNGNVENVFETLARTVRCSIFCRTIM